MSEKRILSPEEVAAIRAELREVVLKASMRAHLTALCDTADALWAFVRRVIDDEAMCAGKMRRATYLKKYGPGSDGELMGDVARALLKEA